MSIWRGRAGSSSRRGSCRGWAIHFVFGTEMSYARTPRVPVSASRSRRDGALRPLRFNYKADGSLPMRSLRSLLVIAVALSAGFAPPPEKIVVYMIGDSTMANKPDPEHNPERGWGQALPPFFDDGAVVDNRAVNGRS